MTTLKRLWKLLVALLVIGCTPGFAQDNSDCLLCHSDQTLAKKRGSQNVSLYVAERTFTASVHGELDCISCHQDLDGAEVPHQETLARVQCGVCHDGQQSLYDECLHGKAHARGDPLAPTCTSCHGSHAILPVSSPGSSVSPLRIPYVCGQCHREGAPVQLQRNIHQANILENYSESIHGEGLLQKGLVVTATCASCHTAHRILPHTDRRSTIARENIAQTCAKCHAQIEDVHQKVIKGELWEREVHVLPACVDCHQPHQIRKVFYVQGMADQDCLQCHSDEKLTSTTGDSMYVRHAELRGSRHAKTTCSQCHSGVNPSLKRPCESLSEKVNCASCHAEVGTQYETSMHGVLFAENDPNAPTCKECHGTHGTLGKIDPKSPIFPTNIPDLCARCHREGEKAAVRYTGTERDIVDHYTESIHGKGLLRSGLVVTAMCTDCHTPHSELPKTDTRSTVNRNNIAHTCGRCHHGIEEQFQHSIHSPTVTQTEKELPVCSECHSAHTIRRTDQEGFKLEIMTNCGRCHAEIAKTYFDTYHGKVSQLGYTKTAKCYDCHGAHNILPISNPQSKLSRENVVSTCRQCHPGATRQFAGYLTHATHHDPDKYPWLYWTFWGMTTLLVGTFGVCGLHTLLWLPRALQMRRQIREEEARSQEVPEVPAGQPTGEEKTEKGASDEP